MKRSTLSLAILAALASPSVLANTTLDPVMVTVNNTEQALHSVTSNVQIITKEQIEEKQYQTLTDALKTVPGISVKGSGGLGKATSIFMRGFDSKNVLILIDGIDLTDPSGLGGANLESIQLASVERIEIIKGPQSGVWGANASAGVINIITKKGGQQASVNVELGSNNTKKISTHLGAGNEQFDFLFSLSQLNTDGFSAVRAANRSHDDFEADPYRQSDLLFKMGINPAPNHRIETLIKTSHGDNSFDDATNPDTTTPTSTYDQVTRQIQYLYNNGQWNSRLYLSENTLNRFNPSYFSEYHGTINELGAQFGLNYRAQDHVQVAINHKEYLGKTTYLPADRFNNLGVALTNTNYLTDTLLLTESIRYDEFDKFKNATTGKIGLKNQFTQDIFVSANIGTAYNAPTLSQLATNNPTPLTPEKSESYDLTLGAYGLEITYFKSEITDLIEFVPLPPPSFDYYYKNANQKILTQGVESSYRLSLDSIKTDIGLNYTWLEAEDADGKTLAYRPNQQGSVALDYYGFKNMHLGLETRYVGEEFATTYGNDISPNTPYKIDIGNYFVSDFKADYAFNKHLTIYGKVVNLFDEAYVENVSNATKTKANFVYSTGGRQFFIGLRGQL